MRASPDDLALALGGGGARSAYQAGVLRGLASRFPSLELPIITGVSAGAINAAHIANHRGSFTETTDDLVQLWAKLTVPNVFDSRGLHLALRALRIGLRLSVGTGPDIQSMVDTRPLREFLSTALGTEDGTLSGIQAKLKEGHLKAVALTTTRYDTGQTVTFFSGRGANEWERPMRRSIETPLHIDHVMASSALPLFFPPIRIGSSWYGDGGVRLVAPLAPALHLGADKILAVSTRFGRSMEAADQPAFLGTPSPAQVVGALYNAIFLDQLDQDAIHMERLNALLRSLPEEKREGLRETKILVMRPSRDLGILANDFEPDLPWMFRFLTRRWGTKKAKSQDLLSTVMFQPDYVRQLIELGESDVDARAEELAEFLGD
jgi:NTE family protein